MRFLSKSGAWIQRISLGENSLHRVDRREFLGLRNPVQPPKNSAGEIPLQLIPAIRRQWQFRRQRYLDQTVMRVRTQSRPLEVVTSRQRPRSIIAPITNGFKIWVPFQLAVSVAKSSARHWIGFPEIYSLSL